MPESGKRQWGRMTADKSIAERLKTKVQFLTGANSRLVPLLQRLGLRSARDVLFDFPRDYEDLTRICRSVPSTAAARCRCAEWSKSPSIASLSADRSVLGVLVRDDTGILRAVWFNQPFMHAAADARSARDAVGHTETARVVLGNVSSTRRQSGPIGTADPGPVAPRLRTHRRIASIPACARSFTTSWTNWPTRCPMCCRSRCWRAASCGRSVAHCAASTCPATATMSGRRGGGSCTRNCSRCSWPWHSAAGTCNARNAHRAARHGQDRCPDPPAVSLRADR